MSETPSTKPAALAKKAVVKKAVAKKTPAKAVKRAVKPVVKKAPVVSSSTKAKNDDASNRRVTGPTLSRTVPQVQASTSPTGPWARGMGWQWSWDGLRTRASVDLMKVKVIINNDPSFVKRAPVGFPHFFWRPDVGPTARGVRSGSSAPHAA